MHPVGLEPTILNSTSLLQGKEVSFKLKLIVSAFDPKQHDPSPKPTEVEVLYIG